MSDYKFLHIHLTGCLVILTQLMPSKCIQFCFNTSDYQHCWSADGSLKTWDNAMSACRQSNSKLLYIENNQIQEAFQKLKQKNSNDLPSNAGVWNNARSSTADEFHWINQPGVSAGVSVVDQDERHPFPNRFAVIVNETTFEARPWSAVSYFICQNTSDLPCADGWHRKTSMCYSALRPPKSWFDASNTCLQNGGTLATFTGQLSDYRDLFPKLQVGSKPYWVGLVRKWWITRNPGSADVDVLFTKWTNRQLQSPDNTDQWCVLLDRYNEWLPYNCSSNELQRFICQVTTSLQPSTSSSSTTTTTTTAAATATRATTIAPSKSQASSTTHSSTNTANATQSSNTSNIVAIAVGVAVGVGGAVIIAVIVVVVILVRRKKKLRKGSDSKYRENTKHPDVKTQNGYDGGHDNDQIVTPSNTENTPNPSTVQPPGEVVYAQIAPTPNHNTIEDQPVVPSGDVTYAELQSIKQPTV